MKALAIITARGGSKRIPRKNIKPFLGQPIIKYSIAAALGAGCFAEVMVSTDDREIADLAIKSGATVPFFRSAKNSDDQASTAAVVEEVLLEYKKQGKEYDYACCLYPTAPFVTSAKLQAGLRLLESSGADSVLPVTRFGYPVQRSFKIDADGSLKMNWPENIDVRSQDLPPVYHDAGQFYCLNVPAFLVKRKLFTDNTKPIIIPERECQDIDTAEDWEIAELKYQVIQRKPAKF